MDIFDIYTYRYHKGCYLAKFGGEGVKILKYGFQLKGQQLNNP